MKTGIRLIALGMSIIAFLLPDSERSYTVQVFTCSILLYIWAEVKEIEENTRRD